VVLPTPPLAIATAIFRILKIPIRMFSNSSIRILQNYL